MTYLDIFVLGWNLNALMFALNISVALITVSKEDKNRLEQEGLALQKLKEELDKYYPYKKQETVITYIFPFVAFFRITFRFVEMYFFFQKNQDAKIFDYMVYKYELEIQKAKNSR